jgi:pimeloyl-ACP methyl ester carboxylesterase
MPDFDSNGVRIHYYLHGPDDGQPIVLVHGYASSYQLNWVGSRWQETLTKAGRLVIGLDCRGHGRSEKPHDASAYARAEMAADVVRLLDHLDIRKADFLGYSMGARIGLDLLIDAQDRAWKAALAGVGKFGAGPGAEQIAAAMRGDSSVELPIAKKFAAFAHAYGPNDYEALAACIMGPHRKLSTEMLAAIKTPVLVITGELDDVLPMSKEVASELGNARMELIENRNHDNAVPARAFKEKVLAFLDAV